MSTETTDRSMWDSFTDWGGEVFSNFGDALVEAGMEQLGFVTTGEPPKTNPTAKQVEQGQKGAPITSTIQPRPDSQSSWLKDGLGFDLSSMSNNKMMMPLLIVGGFVLGALLLRRR